MYKFILPQILLLFTFSSLNSQCLVGVDSNNYDFYSYDFSSQDYTDLRLNAGAFVFDTYLSITSGITNQEVFVGYLDDSGFGSFNPKIIKYNLSDESSIDIITENIGQPIAIDIDKSSNKLYWIDKELDELSRSNLNGTNAEVLGTVTDFLTGWNPVLAVDEINQVIYFTTGGRSIFRTDANNWEREEIISSFAEPAARVGDIAIDEASQFMYWSNNTPDTAPHIVRVDLSTMEEIKLIEVDDDESVVSIQLWQDRIFWTGMNSVVYSAALDGTEVRAEFDADPFVADFVLIDKDTTPPPPTTGVIQGRLDSAVAGDTVWVEGGTYFENIVWPKVDGIVLMSVEDSGSTIIDGGGLGRVITMESSEEDFYTSATVIDGFTLQNGDPVEQFRYHGGLQITNGSPTLRNLIVTNNERGGAGISGFHGTIEDCAFTQNVGIVGGGMWLQVNGDVVIRNCVFSDNLLNDNGLSNFVLAGGGLLVGYNNFETTAEVSLINCVVANNTIGELTIEGFGWGGGIYVEQPLFQGKFVIDSCQIMNNVVATTEESYGGGLYSNTNVSVKNTTFSSNSATKGAGHFIEESFLELTTPVTSIRDCFFHDNATFLEDSISETGIIESYGISDIEIINCQINNNIGKAIHISNGPFTSSTIDLIHNTIAFNEEGTSYENATVNIINTILWNNTEGTEVTLDNLSNASASYSIIKDGIVGESIITDEPQFVSNDSLVLRGSSPGIGQGIIIDTIDFDIAGRTRPLPLGSNPDIGAYEIDQSTVYTNNLFGESLEVFPNPTRNRLYLSTRVNVVHLYDSLGNKLFSDYNTMVINLAHLPTGVYLVELIDNADSITKKVVKE